MYKTENLPTARFLKPKFVKIKRILFWVSYDKWTAAGQKHKAMLRLRTFVTWVSGLTLAMPVWVSASSGAFSAHTNQTGPCSSLWEGTLMRGSWQSLQPNLRHLGAVWESSQDRFHLAQVRGLWPHSFHYTQHWTLSECLRMLCIY